MIRAKQPVEQWEVKGKVPVDALCFNGVVPVVIARRDEELPEPGNGNDGWSG